jgi:hypothetical protein
MVYCDKRVNCHTVIWFALLPTGSADGAVPNIEVIGMPADQNPPTPGVPKPPPEEEMVMSPRPSSTIVTLVPATRFKSP